MKRILTIMALALLAVHGAMAFPSWMGVYDDIERHSEENPGAFTILLNEDYYGLHAELGLRVDDGEWVTHEMFYVGSMDGNAIYEYLPETEFPVGAEVEYFFRAWDEYSTQSLYDSNGGENYDFIAADAPVEVQLLSISSGIGLGCYGQCGRLDLDVKVKNLGYHKNVGIMYTLGGGVWRTLPLRYLGSLGDGYEKWGYHNNFSHREFAMQFAVFYDDLEAGVTYWDNNGGADYVHPEPPHYEMVELKSHGKVPSLLGANGIASAYQVGFFMDIVTADYGHDHPVGIFWSDDNWQSAYASYADFQAELDNGLLKWRVELTGGRATVHKDGYLTQWISPSGKVYNHNQENPDRLIRYAVFFEENGRVHWDNNGGEDFAQSVKP